MDWTHIPVASYVFFGLFVAASIVHLLFCFLEKELARKCTKCLTTLFLSIAAIIAIPTEPLVYLGTVAGMAGDAFLLKKHKVWPFVAGMLSFMVNHILYIAAFIKLNGNLHYSFYLATALFLVLFPVVFFRVANRIAHQKKIALGGAIYFGLLGAELAWGIITCATGHLDYALLCVFGTICFIVSDIFLTKTLFKRDVKRRDFYIMLTYLLAQGLIVVGFVMTLLK